MMMRLIAICMMIVAVCGCAKTKGPTQSPPSHIEQAPISNTDPCATNLHDISGLFLMYLLEHKDLPQDLSGIAPYAKQMGVSDLNCPVSHEPYIYTRDGILLPDQNARIILYDAKPSHSGYRWVIAIGSPSPDQPPRTKVIALPESFFMLRQ